jgi:hypothetical protein
MNSFGSGDTSVFGAAILTGVFSTSSSSSFRLKRLFLVVVAREAYKEISSALLYSSCLNVTGFGL